jgi:hypothetical protein
MTYAKLNPNNRPKPTEDEIEEEEEDSNTRKAVEISVRCENGQQVNSGPTPLLARRRG